jgi:hypothetical protein
LEQLARPPNEKYPTFERHVLALVPWREAELVAPAEQQDNSFLTFPLRLGKQGAWVFRGPVSECVVAQTKLVIGARGDAEDDADVDKMVSLFEQCGYSVANPSYFLRAIEVSGKLDVTSGNKGLTAGLLGGGSTSRRVLLSDSEAAVAATQ